ncbi:MAG TPA: TlpA disulfide reductase family protein [Alphaproteobacteria bacterium]|nr:TlpA disulfide reductase family protein [Alphaproteobacteria bacterium]
MLKPRQRVILMVTAMLIAVGLSYTILVNIQPPSPETSKAQENMEMKSMPAPVVAAPRPSQAGKTLPDAVFYDAEGRAVRLGDFAGEVLLVNLWATWCPPCVAELPALDSLQAKLRDKGLHVVAVSLDRKPLADVAAFLEERRVEQMKLYVDTDRQIPLKWQYAGVPASFLIGRDGVVIEQFDGPREWDKGEMLAKIEAVLGAGATP